MSEDRGSAVTTQQPEHPEVAAIRQAGAHAVAVQKERNQVMRALAGGKWGKISGSDLSDQSRWMMARMAEIFDIDPLTELDILGGCFYIKADAWARKLNALDTLRDLKIINISAAFSKAMREQAKQKLMDADEYGDEDMRQDAKRLIRAAQHADERRAHYQVPDIAVAAYEALAFLDGEPTPRGECNYAPNGPNDPVGRDRPAETARTRTLGRLARKTVPSLRTAESLALKEGIEAEARVILNTKEDARAALPQEGERQALRVGAGEPTAARVEVGTREREPVARRASDATEGVRARDAGGYIQTGPDEEPAEPAGYGGAAGGGKTAALALQRAEHDVRAGMEILGIDSMDDFAQAELGHLPVTREDFAVLQAALARIADSGNEEEGRLL